MKFCIYRKLRIQMKKKAVFFDIDGTLFLPDCGVPASTIEAIDKLKKAGVQVVICTGRARSMVPDNIISLGFDGIIAGAGTYVECNGENIYCKNLDNAIAMELITDMRNAGFIPLPEGHLCSYFDNDVEDESYLKVLSSYFGQASIGLQPIPDDYSQLNVAKVSCRPGAECNKEMLMDKYSSDFNIIQHGRLLFEFIPMYTNKAIGIEKYLEHMGIEQENTYAFGDSLNDIDMLRFVGCGIAMGNSSKDLLEHIPNVTDSIYEDGIFNALEKFQII